MPGEALEPTQIFPPLPGLELGDATPDDRGAPGLLEQSTRRTIGALRDQLTEADAALCQLALTLARTVDRASMAHNVRASSVAMAAKELRECLSLLNPADEEGSGASDAFEQLAQAVRALGT